MDSVITTANPGTNPNHVYQILVQFAKLTAAQTSNVSKAIQTIKQIDSQVKSFPKGRVSQALIQIAKQQAAGNTTLVTQAMNQAVQYIRTGVPGANALVQVAFQAAAGGTPVLNQQLRQIAQQVANGTGAQQTQILQTLQQIALQISNTEGGRRDKVVHTVKVIHDRVSKNNKGHESNSLRSLTICYQSYCPQYDNREYNIYNIGRLIVQTGDPINILGDAAVQVAVGSPGAVQQLNQITEQVSLETGGDPAEIEGVVQNLALETKIKGDTKQVIDNIETEVAKPDDSVSKSLNSLATQEKQGNDEAVNTAIDKVVEGVVGGNDVAKVVATAVADEGTVEEGTTTTADGTTSGATALGGQGTTTEGGATTFAGGTTTTNTDTDESGGDTPLGTEDTDTGNTDTGDGDDDSSDSGDSSDSSDDSGDSGDSDSGDSEDSGDGGKDGRRDGDGDDEGGDDGDGGGDSEK